MYTVEWDRTDRLRGQKMVRVQSSWVAQARLASRICVPVSPTHRLQSGKSAGEPLFRTTFAALVLVLGLCLATSVMAQNAPALANFKGGTPPENAAALSIGTLCPKLTNPLITPQPLTGARQDLQQRCTEIVRNGGQNSLTPLLQVSSDKIPTEGTTKVEAGRVQPAGIGTRLAALRRGGYRPEHSRINV